MILISTSQYFRIELGLAKKGIVFLFFVVAFVAKAQVFNGTGGAIPDNGNDTYFTLPVSGLNPTQIDSTFGLEQVCFTINHPSTSELYIYLQSPSGTMVELTLGSSSSGADFLSTCFNNSSGNSITRATAPYTGTFYPVSYLGRFNTGVSGNGNWNLIVHDGFPGNNAGTLVSWSLQFGTSPAHPVIFNSSNLPIVVINSSQPITELESVATVGIIDNGANRNNITDPKNNYNGKVAINVRGSSTKNFEKKSYSFETQDAVGDPTPNSILGMPSETDWVLNASYLDKTFLRNALAFDLSRSMGHYSSRYKFVEVVENNEYRGMYLLCERPKHNINRINIQKMNANDDVFPDYTGGYIFKIDRPEEAGWYSQLPGLSSNGGKFYFQYVYPKDIEITASQKSYIQGYMNGFETMMNSTTYADPVNGYPKYIDVTSFVDLFIINELSKNVDGYRLSTYMYKDNIDQGGKMFTGPVWDYDIAFHNCNYGISFDPSGWAYQLQVADYPSPTWWIKLMQDPAFINKVYCRWHDLRQNVLDVQTLYSYIDATSATLTEARSRNFRQWPILGAFIFPNPQDQNGATYATEVSDLKNWLANRIAWLDANIGGNCLIGLKEELVDHELKIFPNPMVQSTTFAFKLSEQADVSLCITDLVGKEVARYLNTNVPSGESKIVFEKNQVRSGVYLYQLQINNAIKTGKIIVL
jgi:spore coat protein CotH/subtilisin-like proprotein convertase family protein